MIRVGAQPDLMKSCINYLQNHVTCRFWVQMIWVFACYCISCAVKAYFIAIKRIRDAEITCKMCQKLHPIYTQ